MKILKKNIDFECRAGSGAARDRKVSNFNLLFFLSIDFERRAWPGAAVDRKVNSFSAFH